MIHQLRCGLIAAFLCLFLTRNVYAVPANPEPFQVMQPDGSTVTVVLRGDEYLSWFETPAGFTIAQDSANKIWYYVMEYINDRPVLSQIKADASPPLGLKKHILPNRPKVSPGGINKRIIPNTGNKSGISLQSQTGTHTVDLWVYDGVSWAQTFTTVVCNVISPLSH